MSGGERHDGPWDGSGPADVVSHAQLLWQGGRVASTLARMGIGAGDAVAVQLPMGLESVAVTVGIIQLGARRVSLPVAPHPTLVRDRVRESGARVAIAADACRVEGQVYPVKAALDRYLRDCPEIHTVLVVPQHARPVPWTPGRDRWWHEALAEGLATTPPYSGGMSSASPADRPDAATPPAAIVFDDPLARTSHDDTDEGWGDRLSEDGGAGDTVRFLREKPPHHI
ncbi:AMP-binding protein [Streptomyces avicenniae]|uniref:AMP-binding protein n=1 Tax=Streptomyces avicenniae TaxID=500153 RepID=UPI001CBA6755|nr:AMP-binding protein [Streptomyces avicenniae]